jgi:hypothetical protein
MGSYERVGMGVCFDIVAMLGGMYGLHYDHSLEEVVGSRHDCTGAALPRVTRFWAVIPTAPATAEAILASKPHMFEIDGTATSASLNGEQSMTANPAIDGQALSSRPYEKIVSQTVFCVLFCHGSSLFVFGGSRATRSWALRQRHWE